MLRRPTPVLAEYLGLTVGTMPEGHLDTESSVRHLPAGLSSSAACVGGLPDAPFSRWSRSHASSRIENYLGFRLEVTSRYGSAQKFGACFRWCTVGIAPRNGPFQYRVNRLLLRPSETGALPDTRCCGLEQFESHGMFWSGTN